MSTLTVNKAQTLFRADLRMAPGHPNGSRIVVRPLPVEAETEGRIIKPEEAKVRSMAGTIVTVGDDAADKMYSRGHEVGDEIWFARYAGVVEDWQHIVRAGRGKCLHAGAWELVPKRVSGITDKEYRNDPRWDGLHPHDENEMRECRECGALKLKERIVVMDMEDILINVDLQVRLESGTVERIRGVNPETGAVQYGIVRVVERSDALEIKGGK